MREGQLACPLQCRELDRTEDRAFGNTTQNREHLTIMMTQGSGKQVQMLRRLVDSLVTGA